jgi:tetratricopeptide (TPR) repeat protein
MGSPQDLGNLATVLAHLGSHSEAFELFAKSLSLDPENVSLLNVAGRAYLDDGQLDRASELLGSAAEAAPNSAEVHLNLGLLHTQQGVTQKAIEHLERALALDPSLRTAYLKLGSAYVGDGKLEAAAAVWQQLLTIERDNVAVLRKLGMLHVRLGNYEGAIVALEHAQAIEPLDSPAAIALTRLLATAPATSSRDAPRALAMAMTLFRARPHDPARIDLLGVAYAANGDFARATKLAERALNNALDNPQLAATIGEHLTCYQDEKPVLLPNGGVWMLF